MADEEVNRGRRRFLLGTTAVVGVGGFGTLVTPFVRTWMPSARSEALGSPVTADISKIKPGQMVIYGWHKKPVCIINRTQAEVATLSTKTLRSRLRDPNSDVPQQPAYCKNNTRSIKPEWLVMVLICTHLGCVPDYMPKIGSYPWYKDWLSGFRCPCHHSMYDIAGRVYEGVPAPKNMVVPPYHFIDATHVEIGVGPKQKQSKNAKGAA